MFCAVHNTFYYKEDSTFCTYSIEFNVPRTTLSIQNTLYGKCYDPIPANCHYLTMVMSLLNHEETKKPL